MSRSHPSYPVSYTHLDVYKRQGLDGYDGADLGDIGSIAWPEKLAAPRFLEM